VVVKRGDELCDIDSTAAIKLHTQTGSDATLVVKSVDDPREYGLVNIDNQGMVIGFVEKPAFSQAVSDLANTGIYILSQNAIRLIPDNANFDFAKDLFPLMLHRGYKLMTYCTDGYWCDIGDLSSYRQCQQDMLEGKVDCIINGRVYKSEKECLKLDFKAVPPIYLGSNTEISSDAAIEAGTVIDDNAIIGSNARVTSSIILPHAHIGSGANLTGSVICSGSVVKSKAMLFEGSVIGSNAVIGSGCIVNPGIKIWNGKITSDNTIVSENIKTGGHKKELFDDSGIIGEIGIELTPELCAKLGVAIGSANIGARVAIGSTPDSGSVALKSVLAAGIQSTGASILDFGDNFYSQFCFGLYYCAAAVGVYIQGDGNAAVKLLSEGGLPATREMERSIESIFSRCEFVRKSSPQFGERVDLTGIRVLYMSELLRYAPFGLEGMSAQVICSDSRIEKTASEALKELGCDIKSGISLQISADGTRLNILDEKSGVADWFKILAICAEYELAQGREIAVRYDAPRAIDEIAQKYGAKLYRYYECPTSNSDKQARRIAKTQLWERDAIMLAIKLLSIMKEKQKSLSELISALPRFEIEERTIFTQGSALKFMRDNNTGAAIEEGVIIKDENGLLLVRPLKSGKGLKLYAQAVNSELAAELCDKFTQNLKNSDNQLLDIRQTKS